MQISIDAESIGSLVVKEVSRLFQPAGNLLVLKTPPGSANLVANALDAAGLEEVAGTLAGDDTIFVAIADGTNTHSVADMLQRRRSGA